MKTLWTPWRMEYIDGSAARPPGCPFCAPTGVTHDRQSLLLWRDELLAVFLNRFPYANGHLLVAPSRHVADLTELSDQEHAAIAAMLPRCVAILRRQFAPDGINLGLNLGEVAGAGVASHLHWHLVPRWAGDHNFLTVLAEVRTVPEHIQRTFDRLLPEFACP
ncbi:MAG: HIT family protein [Thermodesulfobacteriota bacterium]